MAKISRVDLGVMTFRNSLEEGALLDMAKVLAGDEPIFLGVKVKLDSNDDPGADGAPAKAENVRWRLYYDGKLDLETDGHANVLFPPGGEATGAWWPDNLGHWDLERGYAAVFYYRSSPARGGIVPLAIETEHDGVVSNRVEFVGHI